MDKYREIDDEVCFEITQTICDFLYGKMIIGEPATEAEYETTELPPHVRQFLEELLPVIRDAKRIRK